MASLVSINVKAPRVELLFVRDHEALVDFAQRLGVTCPAEVLLLTREGAAALAYHFGHWPGTP